MPLPKTGRLIGTVPQPQTREFLNSDARIVVSCILIIIGNQSPPSVGHNYYSRAYIALVSMGAPIADLVTAFMK